LRLRQPTPGLVGSPPVHSSFLAVPGELRRFPNQMHPPLGLRGDKRRGIAPVVLRGLPASFGHRLPWGGGPCSVSCYFLLYAVAAHQLHAVAFLRRLGIVSLGVVVPVLFRVISSCMWSQPASCIPWVAFLRRLGIVSIGVVGGPCSVSCYFFMYAVVAHQLHRASFLRLWHPRICPFLCKFLVDSFRPPVVVAFGHPLPFCLSLLHGSRRMSLRARNRHAVHSPPPFVALYAHRFYLLFAALWTHSLGVLGSPLPISLDAA
jgi:hypothetical protein